MRQTAKPAVMTTMSTRGMIKSQVRVGTLKHAGSLCWDQTQGFAFCPPPPQAVLKPSHLRLIMPVVQPRSSIMAHPCPKRGKLTVVSAAQAAGGATDDPLEKYGGGGGCVCVQWVCTVAVEVLD